MDVIQSMQYSKPPVNIQMWWNSVNQGEGWYLGATSLFKAYLMVISRAVRPFGSGRAAARSSVDGAACAVCSLLPEIGARTGCRQRTPR